MTTATITFVGDNWKLKTMRVEAHDRDKLERRICGMRDLGLYIVSEKYHDEGQGEFGFEEATA